MKHKLVKFKRNSFENIDGDLYRLSNNQCKLKKLPIPLKRKFNLYKKRGHKRFLKKLDKMYPWKVRNNETINKTN